MKKIISTIAFCTVCVFAVSAMANKAPDEGKDAKKVVKKELKEKKAVAAPKDEAATDEKPAVPPKGKLKKPEMKKEVVKKAEGEEAMKTEKADKKEAKDVKKLEKKEAKKPAKKAEEKKTQE